MKNRSFLERFAAVPHLAWTLLFIIAPLLFVVYFFVSSCGISKNGDEKDFIHMYNSAPGIDNIVSQQLCSY
jgi:hypothetical protein